MTSSERVWRTWLACGLLLLAGCSFKPYRGAELANAGFLARSLSQSSGPISITAAVPDAAETTQLTGLDLYGQGIQPIWLRVENTGDKQARIALSSIDADYFSPIEVAYMNRRRYSAEGYADMQRWFHGNGLPRSVPPGGSVTGLVFAHYRAGTRGFNVDVFSSHKAYNFTFFVPMPGFEADYASVDFRGLYPADSVRALDLAGLKTLLEEELPCCASGPEDAGDGGPLNVVFVATPLALRRALLRGEWLETQANSPMLSGAREHRFFGRQPDAIFFLDRPGGHELLNLHLWLAPWQVDGVPVWVGQVYYREFNQTLMRGIANLEILRNSEFLRRFMRESVVADVDNAQRFLLQNFWYNQSLVGVGATSGVGRSTVDNPQLTFDGVGYFTEGQRFVLAVPETPVGFGAVRPLFDGSFRTEDLKP